MIVPRLVAINIEDTGTWGSTEKKWLLYFLKQLTRAGVPHLQLQHFYLTVIRPVLEYAPPVWHHLITKKQSDQIEAIQKRAIRIIYLCAHEWHDMPYTSAIFLADLPTMSDRRDQFARKLFKSTIQPTSSIYHSITSPLKISSHPHQNQKIPIILLTCSLPLSNFIIIVFFHCI